MKGEEKIKIMNNIKKELKLKKYKPKSWNPCGCTHTHTHNVYCLLVNISNVKFEEYISKGRTLIGAGTGTDTRGESLEFTLGQTGGEYNLLLTIEEMPSHSHGYLWRNNMVYWNVSHGYGSGANTGAATIDTSATGNDVAHNNLQPYIVTYMWKRIS